MYMHAKKQGEDKIRPPCPQDADRRAQPMMWPTLVAALCIACSALFAACCALRRTEGFIIAPAATMETTAPATAPVAIPETKGDTCIFFCRLSVK